MLSRKFTLREIILLLIAILLLLGIFYYQVILKDYNEAKVTFNTASLEDQESILTAKAMKYKQMKTYIEEHADDNYGTVAVYNNLSNEIEALSNVFTGIDNVSINWQEPSLTNTIVRRNATITFDVSSYEQAKNIMKSINELEYKCIITSTSLSDGNTTSITSSSDITVELNVTFFETIEGAKTTSGLVVEDTSVTTDVE